MPPQFRWGKEISVVMATVTKYGMMPCEGYSALAYAFQNVVYLHNQQTLP